jgi:thymidylate synthase
MNLKPTSITAYDIPELWHRSLQELWNKYSGDNREYMVEHGSFAGSHKRKEFDYFTGHILNPGNKPMIWVPEGSNITPPTNEETINEYFANYIIGNEKAKNEDYTYGQRINVSLNKIINILKQTSNTNQAIIQVGGVTDIGLKDPPCLRHIDIRIKDNKLHFIIYFRSWDLFNGLPTNLGGLQLLKEYMAYEIGVKDGEMIVSSKGLHVYDYVWSQVEQLINYKNNCSD